MKCIICLLILIQTLTSCALPGKTTTEELIAAPDTVTQITTPLDYDAAYRKALSMMKSCYEVPGEFSNSQVVFGDKGAKDAIISVQYNSALLGNRVIATLRLTPAQNGTQVAIFNTRHGSTTDVIDYAKYWLIRGGSGCKLPTS